ncbi:MAG TPA: hypothetical protein VD931_03910 [Baekduia sp.]|nr:hypothetical protein [Baekduia sp.]
MHVSGPITYQSCTGDGGAFTAGPLNTSGGAYPGSYSTSGTWTTQPGTLDYASYSEAFVLRSATTTIEGTVRLGPSGGTAFCTGASGWMTGPHDALYEATIRTPDGTYRDAGTVELRVGLDHRASFLSSQAAAVPAACPGDEGRHKGHVNGRGHHRGRAHGQHVCRGGG